MKKLLTILFLLAFMLSLVACGTQKDNNSTEVPKDTIATTPSEENTSSTEENKENTEKFSYKMIEALSSEYDTGLEKGRVVYVFYTDAHFTEHSGFEVYTKDGVKISEYNNSKNVTPKYETTYVCDECTIEHAKTTKNDDLNTHDRIVVIILSFKDEVYKFEDLVVKTTVYDDIEAKTGETIELTANATMEDLRLNKKYIHTKSLLQDDAGNWFVCAPDAGSGSSSKDAVFKIVKFSEFLAVATFNGEFELVDINGDPIAIPDGCEKYISAYFGNVNFGLKPIEKDTKLTEEQKDLVDTMHLKYTDKEGNVTYFFN